MQPQGQNVDINAIRQALMARSQGPSMNQGQTSPMLSQVGQPLAPNATGGQPTLNNAPVPTPTPGTPQPQFASPFAGPKPAPAFDEETRKISKALIGKLMAVL